MKTVTELRHIELDINEQDLARAIGVMRGLSFSQIQTTVSQWDVDMAYESQESLRRLRDQLERVLGAIELAREVFEQQSQP